MKYYYQDVNIPHKKVLNADNGKKI